MKDLFLHYQFTDRGDSNVYDIYPADESMTMNHCLGRIRLDTRGSAERIALPKDMTIDLESTKPLTQDACYRNHDNITCKCKACQPSLINENRCDKCGLIKYDGKCTTLNCEENTGHGTG